MKKTSKEKLAELDVKISALLLALKERKIPWYVSLLALLTVAYALSPVDLIPDFIPFLGYIDDIIILPALIALCFRLIPRDVVDSYTERAKSGEGIHPMKRWYYAIPTIVFFLLIIALIVVLIVH